MNTKSLEDLKALDYPVRIEYDREDSLYVATFVDLPGCSAPGPTVTKAYARAQQAKAEWLRVALEQGLPIPNPSKTGEYSGRILVRLPASLHAMLAGRARSNGASLNQYIVQLLSAGAVGEAVGSRLEALAGRLQEILFQVVAGSAYGRFGGQVAAEAEHSQLLARQSSRLQIPILDRLVTPGALASSEYRVRIQ
jgi:antitoxin HicB